MAHWKDPPRTNENNSRCVKLTILNEDWKDLGLICTYGGEAAGKHWHWTGFASRKEHDDLEVLLYIEGPYLRLAVEPTLGLDCAFAKYHSENEVNFFWNHRGDNQKFLVNKDGTISPEPAKNMFFGMKGKHNKLCLVGKEDPRKLVFRLDAQDRPAEREPVTTWPAPPPVSADIPAVTLDFKSHPGKGLAQRYGGEAAGKYWHWAGLENKSQESKIFLDWPFIRLESDPTIALDVAFGKYHHGNHVNFFHNHRGGNQKFKKTEENTICCVEAPRLVLGIVEGGNKLCLVNKGSSHQLVLTEGEEDYVILDPRHTGPKPATEAPTPSGPSKNKNSIVSELRELVNMKKEGLLTDEEFSRAKKILLNSK